MYQEVQRPKRELVKRNALSFLGAFASYITSLITGRAQGPDLSHWDGKFIPQNATELIHFAIMKLTEGTTWIDPLVDTIWNGVKSIRVRGGYHYQRSGMSWLAQADHYLKVAARYSLHFHALDLEEIGNTYSDGMFADTRRIIDYWRSKSGKRVILYTNIHTYELFAASILKQYPSDGQKWLDELELWLAYPSSTLLNPPLPKGRTTWTFWQKAWDGDPQKWGTDAAVDVNDFNGTPQDLDVWAGLSENPAEDVISYPFEGVKTISGERHGWRFTLDICDPLTTRLEVAHATTYDLRETTSAIAKGKGASLAWNGGEWNKYSSPYYPSDYSVSNGVVYVSRKTFVPSLMVLEDGSALIDHVNHSGVKQALSGLRYIVIDGKSPSYLTGTEPQYTEGHARTILGLTAQGHVMVLTVDGLFPNQGWTLLQASIEMIRYGATSAFDIGGGGDTTRVLGGVVTNAPQDGGERRIPEFLLLYAKESTVTDIYELKSSEPTKTRTIRAQASPHIKGAWVGEIPIEGTAQADTKYVYPDAVVSGGVTYAQKGDVWYHVTSVNGKPIDGWTAGIHLGKPQLIVTDIVAPPPPPDPEPTLEAVLDITVTDPATGAKYGATGIKLPKIQ